MARSGELDLVMMGRAVWIFNDLMFNLDEVKHIYLPEDERIIDACIDCVARITGKRFMVDVTESEISVVLI